jgi:hypothetical protein
MGALEFNLQLPGLPLIMQVEAAVVLAIFLEQLLLALVD